MSCLALYFFGSPEIRLDDNLLAIKERKALALLVYLAVRGAAQQRETLVTFFQKRPGGSIPLLPPGL